MISTISQNLSNLFNQNSKQLTKSRRRYSQSPQRFVVDEKDKPFNSSAPSFSHSDDEHSMPQTKNDLNKRNKRYSHVCLKILFFITNQISKLVNNQ